MRKTDTHETDRALEYYREREWRIASGIRLMNIDGSYVDLLRVLTPAERRRLLEIDHEFFSRKISTGLGLADTLDHVLVHSGLKDTRLIEMVRGVIVPAEAVEDATEVLSTLENPPPLISIAELHV